MSCCFYGTSPSIADTDGDGVADGTEVLQGTDPLDAQSVRLSGDINADGQLDVADYLLLTQSVLGLRTPTPAEESLGDMNQVGVLDVAYLLLLSRAILNQAWQDLRASPLGQALLAAWEKGFPSAQAAVTHGALYYVHTDHLGSPVAATDRNGTLLWRETYAPYGERQTREAGSKYTVWYTGKQEEAAFGINYFGARWYDPRIGRFMGVDPAGFKQDNIQSFNKYAYANNNSLSLHRSGWKRSHNKY